MQIRRFYAPPQNFQGNTVLLDEGETRHLRDVLRLKTSDAANVFDGEGLEFECVVEHIEKRKSVLRILNSVEPAAPESKLDLTICASVLKGDKTDFAIQKAVELGVNRFIPMITARCDVKPKSASGRVDRWRKIVLEASKQCGRARLMRVEDVSTFLDQLHDPTERKLLFFSERDGGELNLTEKPKVITTFLGPEGGWDDSEIALARESGAIVITLHGRIMKADTAAIAISAILQHKFGDLN
jgi:16S rRNA (uracil1498-N3)-methyltransferase